MSTNYLKNFAEGETIRASETNANNQFLLNKISDNASDIQLTVQTQISNVKSELATTKTNLESQLEKKLNQNDKELIMSWMIPDYSKGSKITSNSFTAPSNGLISGYMVAENNSTLQIKVNGYVVAQKNAGGYMGTGFSPQILVKKGDEIYFSSFAAFVVNFFPARGEE